MRYLVLLGAVLLLCSCGGTTNADRAKLLKQIDEYEAWTKTFEAQYALADSRRPTAYDTARNQFAVQRHPFQEYLAWWQDDYWKNSSHSGIDDLRRKLADPVMLRDRPTIDRFLATR